MGNRGACLLLQRETLFLSSKTFHYIDIVENIGNVAVCASAHKMYGSVRDHQRIVSQKYPEKLSCGGTEAVCKRSED